MASTFVSALSRGAAGRLALVAIALPAFVGCMNFGSSGSDDAPARPTIRQVRAEWREMERNGLLPVLEKPLAPDEDFAERLAPTNYAGMSHPRETAAGLARLRETAEQIENEATREAFLEADRQRDQTRADALRMLFYRRYDDDVSGEAVWKEWERLDRAFAALEQDAWVEKQRLIVLHAMLHADVVRSTPRLIEALGEQSDSQNSSWRALISNLPSPVSEPGRPLWRQIAELELDGEPARGVLDRLAYETELGGLTHPLSSPEETGRLLEWMESEEPTDFGLKKMILNNAEHFPRNVAEPLYDLGENDPSPAIQIHASFCAAQQNEDERRIARLVELSDDERYAATARLHLQSLGKAYRVRPATDPLRKAREVAYQTCAGLRYEVDATPEELTLIAQSTLPWEEGETPEDVYVFSYRLPDAAKPDVDEADRQPAPLDETGEPAAPTAYEELRGYVTVFDENAYTYSVSEIEQAKCETALDVAALTHRDYLAYEWDASTSEKSVPDYAAELAEKDWRWGELRVPLPPSDE